MLSANQVSGRPSFPFRDISSPDPAAQSPTSSSPSLLSAVHGPALTLASSAAHPFPVNPAPQRPYQDRNVQWNVRPLAALETLSSWTDAIDIHLAFQLAS
ncbi:hypothetical protein SCLCIDRAFT_19402 [Scleroderma citrinum Foug A]|uniref:Uncharacterized protein n=1 Tax=Scleroderma citrinum Foug A TaxID=1036808 RepID=A0A0C3E9W1_9AGAM|nr:hypothetical protein SCLCIDRAFT_19402 [Scleroderma citrinum Foug A]